MEEIAMEVKLDIDSKRALKLLTIAVNDLIDSMVSLNVRIQENTTALEGAE